jgi:archaeal flagellar protein FlaF
MAGAEIIGAAIGVLLLVLVGYIMVGSTLTSAEIVASAQKDMTAQNEARLQTHIEIYSARLESSNKFNLSLNNTGSETIGDFPHMDIFSYEGLSGYQRYTYTPNSNPVQGEWTIVKFDRDFVHPSMLDPGEAMWICATYSGTPTSILVSTSNGVFTSSPIPHP